MIMPGLVETQLGVGRKKGHGVFLSRNEKGEWGNPEPFEISGVSVGAVAGRYVTDRVLIYRTQKAADKHGVSSLSLGLSMQASGSLKHKNKLSGPEPDSKTKRDILTYERHRGILVGAAISGEHKWSRSPAPVALKTPPTTDRNVADGKDKVKVTLDASATEAKAKQSGDSPEVARLKTVLTAMTTHPPARIAETGTKDLNVSPASGAKPSAETAASPR